MGKRALKNGRNRADSWVLSFVIHRTKVKIVMRTLESSETLEINFQLFDYYTEL